METKVDLLAVGMFDGDYILEVSGEQANRLLRDIRKRVPAYLFNLLDYENCLTVPADKIHFLYPIYNVRYAYRVPNPMELEYHFTKQKLVDIEVEMERR